MLDRVVYRWFMKVTVPLSNSKFSDLTLADWNQPWEGARQRVTPGNWERLEIRAFPLRVLVVQLLSAHHFLFISNSRLRHCNKLWMFMKNKSPRTWSHGNQKVWKLLIQTCFFFFIWKAKTDLKNQKWLQIRAAQENN